MMRSLIPVVAILLVGGQDPEQVPPERRLNYHTPPKGTRPEMKDQHKYSLLSPLQKDDGSEVGSREEWYRTRRPELVARWRKILGKLGPNEADRKWFGDISKVEIVGTEQKEGYTRIHLRIPLEKDFLQEHLLLLPRGQGKGPFPAVIAWTSTSPDYAKPEEWWGAWLARRGTVVLTSWAFIRHYRGGTNYRRKANELVYERFGRWLAMAKMVHDVQREVEYLKTRAEVDSTRIGFIGFSLSAKSALYVAAFAPEIAATVSVDPHMAIHGDTNYGDPWYLDWTRKFPDIRTDRYPVPELRGTVWSLLDADPKRPGFERNHHELLALCAPRAFLLVGCSMNRTTARHSDDLQSWGYFNRAREVYGFLGIPERISIATTDEGHRAVSPRIDPAWQAFFERWLKKEPIRFEGYSRSAPGKRSPLSPEEARDRFVLPEGFRVELAAAEPDVRDPVAMAFDRQGRMLVVEMDDYPVGPASGRVRLLEDRDGDGRFEKSSVFADKVPFPTGVIPWKKGMLVCSAPDILYLEDTDGDGRADVRKVMLTGFGTGDNPQSFVNNPQYGVDGWIYLGNGGMGGEIRNPERPGDKPVRIRGTDLRWRPETGEVEVLSGRSQYAMTLDDWDRRFINSNANHIRHPAFPLRYLKNNPHLRVPAVEENISDHGTSARVFPISLMEERFNDPHHAGHFTSACAVTVYRGGVFAKAYRGNAFVCEPVHNLVHRDVLVERGASFTARRGAEGRDFLVSSDPWFRPVNLCTGPDGALYVVDFYRAVVDHPKFIPLSVQKKIRLLAGRDRGRIWRITSGKVPRPGAIDLDSAKTARLVELLSHPNAWWRLMAQRVLLDRKDPKTAELILETYGASGSAVGRLHALWTLEVLSRLDERLLGEALRDPAPGVREHAFRMAEPRLASSPALRQSVPGFRVDSSARVRFQIALTLGRIEGREALEALAEIAARDAADGWVRTAVLASMGKRASELLSILLERSEGFLKKPEPGALDLVRGMAGVVAARRKKDEARAWARQIASDGAQSPLPWHLAALAPVRSLLDRGTAPKQIRAWSRRSLATALDGSKPVGERKDAIALLTLDPVREDAAKLKELLTAHQPEDVQTASVRALAGWPGVDLDRDLLPGWGGYTVRVRRELLTLLLRRRGVEPVLKALEKGILRPVDLAPHHRNALLKHRDEGVRERARKLLVPKGYEDRAELVAELTPKILALKGDRLRGEKVFKSNCATCHRFYGQGYKVGPDLASVATREKEKLVSDILDPNRAMDPAFQVYVLTTKTGTLVSGIIAAETPNSITLRRAMGEETTVFRRDIKEFKAWPASLMPDGVENNVDDQGFADLLEYLKRGMR